MNASTIGATFATTAAAASQDVG